MTGDEFIAAWSDAYWSARDSGLSAWGAQQAANAATDDLLDDLEN